MCHNLYIAREFPKQQPTLQAGTLPENPFQMDCQTTNNKNPDNTGEPLEDPGHNDISSVSGALNAS
jgi:hypothetical protein